MGRACQRALLLRKPSPQRVTQPSNQRPFRMRAVRSAGFRLPTCTLLLRSTLCSSPGPETSSNYYSTERKERKQGSAPAPAASENDISSSGAAPSKWSVLLGRYGRIAIGTHLVIGLTHLSCWYVAIRSGLDVNEMLLTYGGTVGETVLDRLPDGAGGFLLAYGIHKATSPVRMMVTVGATPVVASALGLQRKTPP